MTTTTTAENPMTDTDFYTPPTLAEHHRPGDILRLRPTPTPGLAGAGPAWQVLYASRDTYHAPIPVSGTVITPTDSNDPTAPIVVYYPAFHGLGGAGTAPSQRLAAGAEPDSDQISAALARGWRVAVVDGEGLGVLGRGPHTVLAGRAAGQVMLDLGRAATAIPALNASDAAVGLWGYGDGGRAAIWAGALAPGYAPHLRVRGVAAGAVVTDPEKFLRAVNQGSWPALGLAGILGLSRAHRHLPLRHVFTEQARRLLAEAETASVEVLCQRWQHRLATWCDRPVWTDPVWRHVFTHEAIGTILVPAVPVHLYHGSRDAIVPVELGRQLHRDYHDSGVEVSWCEHETDHFRTRTHAIDDVLAHLSQTLTTPASSAPTVGRTAGS